MVRQLIVTEPGGAEVYRGEMGWAQSLRSAVLRAVYRGGLRDTYLRRYSLLPGPLCVGVSGGERGVLELAVMRPRPDCKMERDPATVRRLRYSATPNQARQA